MKDQRDIWSGAPIPEVPTAQTHPFEEDVPSGVWAASLLTVLVSALNLLRRGIYLRGNTTHYKHLTARDTFKNRALQNR